ncbi:MULTISPECIES: hypothetical protein [unclassified Shewanella]|uniref:hypothetical protein n=1 Tax=unclassified Shewanella TaxID=196818 RepID=UPI00354C6825
MIKQKAKHLRLGVNPLDEKMDEKMDENIDYRSLYIDGISSVNSGLNSLFECFENSGVFISCQIEALTLLQVFEEFEDLFFDGLEDISVPVDVNSVEHTEQLDSGEFIDAIFSGQFEGVFTVDYQNSSDNEVNMIEVNTSLRLIDNGFKLLLKAQGLDSPH